MKQQRNYTEQLALAKKLREEMERDELYSTKTEWYLPEGIEPGWYSLEELENITRAHTCHGFKEWRPIFGAHVEGEKGNG